MSNSKVFKTLNSELERNWRKVEDYGPAKKTRKHKSTKAAKKATKPLSKTASLRKLPAQIIAFDNKKKRVVVQTKNSVGATQTTIRNVSSVKKDINSGRKYFVKNPNNRVVVADDTLRTKGDGSKRDNLGRIVGSVVKKFSYPKHHLISKIYYSLVMIGLGMIACIGILSYLITK